MPTIILITQPTHSLNPLVQTPNPSPLVVTLHNISLQQQLQDNTPSHPINHSSTSNIFGTKQVFIALQYVVITTDLNKEDNVMGKRCNPTHQRRQDRASRGGQRFGTVRLARASPSSRVEVL